MRIDAAALMLGILVGVGRPAFAGLAIDGNPITWVRDAEVIVRVRAVEEMGTRITGTLEERRSAYDVIHGRGGGSPLTSASTCSKC